MVLFNYNRLKCSYILIIQGIKLVIWEYNDINSSLLDHGIIEIHLLVINNIAVRCLVLDQFYFCRIVSFKPNVNTSEKNALQCNI